MLKFLCRHLWDFCEFFHLRCPFAPWVFGKMIGARGEQIKPPRGKRGEK